MNNRYIGNIYRYNKLDLGYNNSVSQIKKEVYTMATNSNRVIVENKQDALDRMKFEIARELGVDLKPGYNGDITARDAGRVGGEMVRRLIAIAEKQL